MHLFPQSITSLSIFKLSLPFKSFSQKQAWFWHTLKLKLTFPLAHFYLRRYFAGIRIWNTFWMTAPPPLRPLKPLASDQGSQLTCGHTISQSSSPVLNPLSYPVVNPWKQGSLSLIFVNNTSATHSECSFEAFRPTCAAVSKSYLPEADHRADSEGCLKIHICSKTLCVIEAGGVQKQECDHVITVAIKRQIPLKIIFEISHCLFLHWEPSYLGLYQAIFGFAVHSLQTVDILLEWNCFFLNAIVILLLLIPHLQCL